MRTIKNLRWSAGRGIAAERHGRHKVTDTLLCTTMMKLCAQPARIWSAVTCHRFCSFGDRSAAPPSPKQGRGQRPGRVGRVPASDGHKAPAESADKSTHSKVVAAPPPCAFCASWRHSAVYSQGFTLVFVEGG